MKYSILIELKDKNHMILSIDTEKALDKMQYLLMIKIVKLGRKGNFLKLIKSIYLKTHS